MMKAASRVLVILLLIACLCASGMDAENASRDADRALFSLDRNGESAYGIGGRAAESKNDRALFVQSFILPDAPPRAVWISIPVASLLMLLILCFSDKARMKG